MRVLVITGAGISAESGIPTFRGKNGYWQNFDPAKLATPEAFARDPQLVWEWYRERRQRIREAKPNAAHEAIVQLAAKTREFLLVTQNVDDLHLRAEWKDQRLAKEKIVQIHGDIFATRCDFAHAGRGGSPEPPVSRAIHPRERRLRSIAPTSEREQQQDIDLPICPRCGALMRPGVVWFGEQLDAAKIARVENFLADGPGDAVLVIGTTALFGYIVDWAMRAAGQTGRLVEINPEETSLSQFATEVIRGPAALALPNIVDRLITGQFFA